MQCNSRLHALDLLFVVFSFVQYIDKQLSAKFDFSGTYPAVKPPQLHALPEQPADIRTVRRQQDFTVDTADIFFLCQQLQHFPLLIKRLYGCILNPCRQLDLLLHLISSDQLDQCTYI